MNKEDFNKLQLQSGNYVHIVLNSNEDCKCKFLELFQDEIVMLEFTDGFNNFWKSSFPITRVKTIKKIPSLGDHSRAVEPKLHSGITDTLPNNHKLVHKSICCDFTDCKTMLHASNNENMVSWIETGKGNFCWPHFLEQAQDGIPEDWGILLPGFLKK